MSKLRIAYIVSLIILAALIGLLVYHPLTTGTTYSEVAREGLIQTDNEYIIQFDIINHESVDTTYAIQTSIDGELFNHSVSIPDGKKFTYMHHVYKDKLTQGNVSFSVYKEGEAASPFEQITYHLDLKKDVPKP